jgi:hypothetical protein
MRAVWSVGAEALDILVLHRAPELVAPGEAG